MLNRSLINVKNLTQFEFSKALLKIRETYCDNDNISSIFTDIINDFDLTKKDIRTIIESKENDNTKFIESIQRSIKNNKNDSTEAIARKLEKHCKRESTENSNKHDEIKKEYIYLLLLANRIDEICEKLPRIVVFLDNAKAHRTDLVKLVAKMLNISLFHIPKYSPEFSFFVL